MDGCTDTDGGARRRPAGSRLEGSYGVGLEAGWGMKVPSQLVEPVPEAYTETRAAPARAWMEMQPLRRSIEQKMDPGDPAAFPGVSAPSSQEIGEMLAPQVTRPHLSLPSSR